MMRDLSADGLIALAARLDGRREMRFASSAPGEVRVPAEDVREAAFILRHFGEAWSRRALARLDGEDGR